MTSTATPATAPATTTPSFVPTAPTMGRVVLTEQGPVAFSGGKQNADWTGLDPTAPTEPPLQMRPILDKNHMKRHTGMIIKHGRKSDLSRLQDELAEHLEQNCMDTIAYLKNPRDPTSMNNSVTDHPQYTGGKVSTLMDVQVLLYDKYNKSNDKAAREYLLDSLELDFCRDIEEQSRDINTFPELYMVLIRVITDNSMEHWEQVKSTMRMLDPTSAKYDAENITALTRDFATYARPLKAAGKYEHELPASLLSSILKAKS